MFCQILSNAEIDNEFCKMRSIENSIWTRIGDAGFLRQVIGVLRRCFCWKETEKKSLEDFEKMGRPKNASIIHLRWFLAFIFQTIAV